MQQRSSATTLSGLQPGAQSPVLSHRVSLLQALLSFFPPPARKKMFWGLREGGCSAQLCLLRVQLAASLPAVPVCRRAPAACGRVYTVSGWEELGA